MKCCFIFMLISLMSFAQPGIVWQKTIGGNNFDWVSESVILNENYYVFGKSLSTISGDKTINGNGGLDLWVLKLSFTGEIVWQKTFGGISGEENFNCIITTSNKLLLGNTSASNISGNKTENSRGGDDYWIVQINELGIIDWQKTIGGDKSDSNANVIQCNDTGYFVGGSSNSAISGEKSENLRGTNIFTNDFWVLKLDAEKNIEWQRTIGGVEDDFLVSILQMQDGGFLLAGHSASNTSFEKADNSRGAYDYWVIKLSPDGAIEWQKTIGGSEPDLLYDAILTSENDILLAGTSYSGISGDKTVDSNGSTDYWVVKLNDVGDILWQKSIGGSESEFLYCVTETDDGNFLLGGSSRSSISGDKISNSRGQADYWIVLIDTDGNILGQKTIGGSNNEGISSIQESPNGGFFLAGNSLSNISGEKTENSRGESDYWVMKLENNSLGFANPILSNLALFPNPTTELVTIRFNQNFSGNIMQTDMLGKVIQNQTIESSDEVSFLLLGEEGIYFVTMTTISGEEEVVRVMKKK